jgi:uracil-DNA glycosylase
MLNSILTVDEGDPNSHKDIGWEQFTDAVILKISTEKSNIVFLFWGTKAIAKKEIIACKKHLVLTAPHPSPLSAYRGFFGSKHFSQTNQYFRKLGITEINW